MGHEFDIKWTVAYIRCLCELHFESFFSSKSSPPVITTAYETVHYQIQYFLQLCTQVLGQVDGDLSTENWATNEVINYDRPLLTVTLFLRQIAFIFSLLILFLISS